MSNPLDSSSIFTFSSQGILRAPLFSYHSRSARSQRRLQRANSPSKDESVCTMQDTYSQGIPAYPPYLQSTIYALLVEEQYRLYCLRYGRSIPPRSSKHHNWSNMLSFLDESTTSASPPSLPDPPPPRFQPSNAFLDRLERQDLRLPSAWNQNDGGEDLTITDDKLGVTFRENPSFEEDSPEASSIRANHSIKPQCGLFYYEVDILAGDQFADGHVGVGFGWNVGRTDRMPGGDGFSWGYHGDTGHIFAASLVQGGQLFSQNDGHEPRRHPRHGVSNMATSSSSSSSSNSSGDGNALAQLISNRPTSSTATSTIPPTARSAVRHLIGRNLRSSNPTQLILGPSQHRAYGPTFGVGDVVGCGLDFRNNSIFFTRNGVHLGTAFCNLRSRSFYPMVGFKTPGDRIHTNFGQQAFLFDIEQYRRDEMHRTIDTILCKAPSPLPTLHRPRSQSSLPYTYDQPHAGHISDHHRLFRHNRTQPANATDAQQEKHVLNQLVRDYLHHSGYIGTLLAFQQQIATSPHPPSDLPSHLSTEVDRDVTTLRHDICQDMRKGYINQVFRKCEQHFPALLDHQPVLCFRLRCQKFLYCVQQMNTSSANYPGHIVSTSPPMSPSSMDDLPTIGIKRKIQQQDLLLGEPPTQRRRLDDDEDDSTYRDAQLCAALEPVMAYGRFLQDTYGPKSVLDLDPSQINVKDELAATFSILAYANANDNPNIYLIQPAWHESIAGDLNQAILSELGQPTTSTLERAYQQTSVAVHELVMLGDGEASMIPQLDTVL
ncbi:SPRY-domain-containing protein [Hesseltinella vesiculosa]|uniref:SPRY-domain-containing protein n=1 Tax=Hesseltinella vesiculosa TaxID=101127 RepID=A0A1X2G9N1_9FUNG|nr:SPRY-domain-containing protein [Hesseltinella vesiculosa]